MALLHASCCEACSSFLDTLSLLASSKTCLKLHVHVSEYDCNTPLTPCPQAEPAREQMHEIGSTVTPGLPELPRAPVRSHADPVSSHILDTTAGRPAAGVAITMSRMGGVNQAWTKVASRLTNEDGRATAFLTWEQFTPGTYKMHFATGQYFR